MSSQKGTSSRQCHNYASGEGSFLSSSSVDYSESSVSSSVLSSASSLSGRVDAKQGYGTSSFTDIGSPVVRRRLPPTAENGYRSGSEVEWGQEDNKRNGNGNCLPRHRHTPRSWICRVVSHFSKACHKNQPFSVNRIPTIFLAGCFLFWLVMQTSDCFDSVSQTTQHEEHAPLGQRHERRKALDNNPTNDASPAPTAEKQFSFFSNAVEGLFDLMGVPPEMFRRAARGEGLPPGCVRSPWQVLNLQNCNDMHETDLYETFSGRLRKDGGFVGSGYWRHVWLVDPRQEYDGDTGIGTVLKMMKSEHKVETRNFERHRRDALAMERLTASKYIVDIYAYCGNSVLTEYVGSDMHQILYHADDDEVTVSKRQLGPRTDRETLQLALEVIQGVADLHEAPGGPIVHADIADKQFLVDDKGHVKLNDFNRCRFMGHKRTTKEKCAFRIPSAPGRHRSPEEYEDQDLTEQLDTYSTANVLYGILTGSAPWADLPSTQVKRSIKSGLKPPIDEIFRTSGTASSLLASLIDQAYEHDPEDRITAPSMAEELKKALQELKY